MIGFIAMDDSAKYRLYWGISAWLAGLCAVITFIGAYWYCTAEYGFLLGFGFGWLPSGILALIVGGVVYLLWLPLIVLLLIGIVLWVF